MSEQILVQLSCKRSPVLVLILVRMDGWMGDAKWLLFKSNFCILYFPMFFCGNVTNGDNNFSSHIDWKRCSLQSWNRLQRNPCGQLHTIKLRPLIVLVFATYRLRSWHWKLLKYTFCTQHKHKQTLSGRYYYAHSHFNPSFKAKEKKTFLFPWWVVLSDTYNTNMNQSVTKTITFSVCNLMVCDCP